MKTELEFKVHTPNLLKEILTNHGTAILSKPITIFGKLLAQIGERAAELNDPILNDLCCKLVIYEIADPESQNYDKEKVEEISTWAEFCKAINEKKS